MEFLLQTFNAKIKHPFCHTLIESCEYQNWVGRTEDFSYYTRDVAASGSKVSIPIGSVEFVHEFMEKVLLLQPPAPINIPDELMDYKFTNRKVIYGYNEDVTELSFVKSMDTVKGYNEITKNPPPGNYQISELINIDSEWRAFVYQNKLVGLKNYTGDFKIFPDVRFIEIMIGAYSIYSPVAYTLDVLVNHMGTYVIEVHNFYSCGLYGFDDHRYLPFMHSRWWNEYLIKNIEQ